MRRIQIPDTDLGDLFPLGLGTVGAGKKFKGKEAMAVFDSYYDVGGNVIDTARVYSQIGKSEPCIGEWIQRSGKRHDVILISKGGHPDLMPLFVLHKLIPRMQKKDMVEDLNASLKDLHTDYLDIYLYHRDNVNQPVEELIEIMEDFVRDGKIRYYGCSNWSLPRIKEADAYCKSKGYRGFVMNQSMLNAASDHVEELNDKTLQIIDKEMQQYHEQHPELLACGFAGNCGGFFQQYIDGGEKAVKDKSYLTPENIELAKNIQRRVSENGTDILKEVFRYYKELPFQALPLFGPRNAGGLVELAKFME